MSFEKYFEVVEQLQDGRIRTDGGDVRDAGLAMH